MAMAKVIVQNQIELVKEISNALINEKGEINYHASLNHIDVSQIKDFSKLFSSNFLYSIFGKKVNEPYEKAMKSFDIRKFNGDISEWDLSNAETIAKMFEGSDFNAHELKWNLKKLKNADYMFHDAKYNHPFIAETHSLSSARGMFKNCAIENKEVSMFCGLIHDGKEMFSGTKLTSKNLLNSQFHYTYVYEREPIFIEYLFGNTDINFLEIMRFKQEKELERKGVEKRNTLSNQNQEDKIFNEESKALFYLDSCLNQIDLFGYKNKDFAKEVENNKKEVFGRDFIAENINKYKYYGFIDVCLENSFFNEKSKELDKLAKRIFYLFDNLKIKENNILNHVLKKISPCLSQSLIEEKKDFFINLTSYFEEKGENKEKEFQSHFSTRLQI